MKKGKLIVFEGISGTGKETQAVLLKEYLLQKNVTAHIVYHPTPEGKEILVKWRKSKNIDRFTEVYLLLADRYTEMQQVIKPAIGQGEWVISLRNYVSALVYQGKTDEDRKWIRKEFKRFEPEPDILFWFDIDPQTAMNRIMLRHAKTGEAIGRFETPELLNEKREHYREILDSVPYIPVNASENIETIHSLIKEKLMQFIYV